MSEYESSNWYYASAQQERQGPVSIGELRSLAKEGVVAPTTLVWSRGFENWVPAQEVAELLDRGDAVPSAVADCPVGTLEAEEVEEPAEMEALELKPRKGLYVLPRMFVGLVVSVLIGGLVAVVMMVMEQSPWPGLGVMVAGGVLAVVASLCSYRKEHYQIQDSRVICRRGGLVSDQTTELEVRNITHVKLQLPWLRHLFFGVGNVMIETAGTSKPVVLRLIAEPEAIYAGMRVRMKRNGYDLSQRQLLHEERPALIGILGEVLKMIVGCVVLGLILLGNFLAEEGGSMDFDSMAVSVSLGFIAVAAIAFMIVRFLDYRRRTYRVYDDVVVYDEGFLTRENAFIPCENIADSNTKSSLLDQLLGLCDVQVSCQGSGAEIKFRRLRHGVALTAAIDQLVARAREKRQAVRPATGQAGHALPRRSEPDAIVPGEVLMADFGMDAMRTMVPLMFLLPLFPVWLAAMILAGIRLASTRYMIRGGSLRHSYRFLTVHEREFAFDKITGLMIKQNLWDRMFGTMTLKFWSIGSGQALEFAHVRGNQFDLPALMRQIGISAPSSAPYEANARLGVFTWLRANVVKLSLQVLLVAGLFGITTQIEEVPIELQLMPGLVALGICTVMGAGAYVVSKWYHSRQRLRFHDHHIEAEQGIISKRRYYVRYRNVKRCQVTRYPGGEDGNLEIFVAAEEEIQLATQEKEDRRKTLKQVSFTTRFLPVVCDKSALLDDILCGRVDPAPQAVAAEPLAVLLEARRSVGNALAKLLLVSFVLPPLLVLLPITIPATVVWARRWRYRIEAARIVVSWGKLFRRETTMLLDRVDSLQQRQGPMGKIFGNGSVSIMTAGSSKPDLKLTDSREYLGMYEIIRECSQ